MALPALLVTVFAALAAITLIVGFRAMKSAVSHKNLMEGD